MREQYTYSARTGVLSPVVETKKKKKEIKKRKALNAIQTKPYNPFIRDI